MADYLHSDHHDTILTSRELADTMEDATRARDLPGMADVDFSLLAFCGRIRQIVKVALSGECADEIFGGYPWYRDPEVRAVDGFPWAQNTLTRVGMMSSQLQCRIDGEDYVRQRYRDTCLESDVLPGVSAEERRMKEMVNLNFRWFMQTLLDRKDRMSMHSGLEVRVPFCDWRIAEYLYRVPWKMKDLQGREKGLLRKAMEGILPEEVLYRKKNPYPKTFDPRYTRLVEQRLQAVLQEDAPVWHLLDREAAKAYLSGESAWPWYGQLMGRPQTIAWILQVDYWLKRYNPMFLF
jgi:asparagine synthase (glutamine-hydrolysing)